MSKQTNMMTDDDEVSRCPVCQRIYYWQGILIVIIINTQGYWQGILIVITITPFRCLETTQQTQQQKTKHQSLYIPTLHAQLTPRILNLFLTVYATTFYILTLRSST